LTQPENYTLASFIRLVVTWCWARDQKTVIGCR